MIVIEANEIPLEVFVNERLTPPGLLQHYVKSNKVRQTILDDVDEAFLYPSQAWASISTALPTSEHQIKWYNDAKPHHPFYWRKAVDADKSVMVVNVLHTGSIKEDEAKKYSFLFPDFFTLTPPVSNSRYLPLQQFNNAMSVSNGRQSSLKNIAIAAIKAFVKRPSLRYWGLSVRDAQKWLKLFILCLKNKEAVRNAQFILQQRVFLEELNAQSGKDLSVLFTNHVASTLHRHFPNEITKQISGKLGEQSIRFSMGLLSDFMSEIKLRFPERELVLITAIGQKANLKLDDNYMDANKFDYKLVDVEKLLNYVLGKKVPFNFLPEMVPQYSVSFDNADLQKEFIRRLEEIGSDPNSMRHGYYVPSGIKSNNTHGFFAHIDEMENHVTLTTTVRPDREGNIIINGQKIDYRELGFTEVAVKDFHSGEHSKFGVIMGDKIKFDKKPLHFKDVSRHLLSSLGL